MRHCTLSCLKYTSWIFNTVLWHSFPLLMQAAFFFFYTTDTRKETSQISFLLRFRCFWYVEDVTRRTWMHGIWQKRAEQCGLTMVCVGPAENAVWSHDNHPHVRYKKNLFSVFISEGRTCTLYLEIFSTFLIHSWFILDSTFLILSRWRA